MLMKVTCILLVLVAALPATARQAPPASRKANIQSKLHKLTLVTCRANREALSHTDLCKGANLFATVNGKVGATMTDVYLLALEDRMKAGNQQMMITEFQQNLTIQQIEMMKQRRKQIDPQLIEEAKSVDDLLSEVMILKQRSYQRNADAFIQQMSD